MAAVAIDAVTLSDDERVARIRSDVAGADRELRARHPWLNRQNTIGAAIMAVALSGMLACAIAYARGAMPGWLVIPLVAIFASLTHELEHDLIHTLYFRKRPWARHLMLALAWIARPSTINPWIRIELHLRHHKLSGTPQDIEERAITNGVSWGRARLLMLADAPCSVLIRFFRAPKGARARVLWRSALAYFPLGWIHWGLWWCFLIYTAGNAVASLFGVTIAWPQAIQHAQPWLDFLIVVWIAPNVLRSFCLHTVSSNMHYYGDVEPGNLMQQTQVLKPWWLWPLQLFCFNFGATHAIHHFVVPQPFYVRQWIARRAYPVMREMGVRFNDTASIGRANRWGAVPGA
jgi:hypothetical protein